MTMTTTLDRTTLDQLAHGTHADPFAVLGRHDDGDGPYIRAVLPGAESVEAVDAKSGAVVATLDELGDTGVFEGPVRGADPYRLKIRWPGGITQETADPYSFGLLLGELDLHLLGESRHFELASALGANVTSIDGVEGVRFAVWAPNATRVAVVGDFNSWDRRRHPMRVRFPAGVWELFVPGLKAGERYKFAINGPDGAPLADKADPVAKSAESAPGTASVVAGPQTYSWTDEAWMQARGKRHEPDAPLSFYEVHLGSWLKDGRQVDWNFAIEKLVPYAAQMGFTHIELLPVAEHPFGGSWGYQPLGLFAPTGRYGSPDDFAKFVDAAHAAGVGVVVDWVPAHFPTDPHGLYRFDGTPLYEHADPREGFHTDWNTAIYNFGRKEVQNFLIASGLHWLERFHVDGLRVDAVASMLYRDYSRKEGEWVPNHLGGRENLEAIGFLQHFNAVVRERVPGAITIAEESTAWPGVTRSTSEGGLGFHYKWNMGWMHDTLNYMEQNPIYRSYNHDGITFGLVYAFSEKFVLPLSHDEVVHGKGSLINKMPGDTWQKFANLRALYGLMWSHPGKKLLFMGGEIAQWREWNHDGQIDWPSIDDPAHVGVQRLVRDLNRIYAAEPALHRRDCEESGFHWVIGDDRANSVFAFRRLGNEGDPQVLVVANMTPVPRHEYRIGVPVAGRWSEIINTDSGIYGGSNVGNSGAVETAPVESHGEAQSLLLSLPPLAVIALRAG